MKITSVEKNKKTKDRLYIYIDGEYSFSISEDDYLALNLYEEKEISLEDVHYIKGVINFRSAKASAVRFTSLKLRNEKEVRSKLETEGYDNDVINNAIDDLKALGYINDRIYVRKYVFDRSKLKPKSKRLLKLELLNRGVSEDIIDEVLNDYKIDETVVAESLVRKKFAKYNMDDDKIIKRVYSFLRHRGYSFETIKGVLNKINDKPGL